MHSEGRDARSASGTLVDGIRGKASHPRWCRTRSARPYLVSAVLLMLTVAAPGVTHACSVCFGASDSPMAKATNNAILLMLGIVGFVQVGFVALFFTFWRRARALRKKREQFRLIDGLAR